MGDLVPINMAEKITDVVEYCTEFAEAATRFTGAQSVAEGKAVMLTCLQEGLTIVEFSRRYHLLDGRPTMRTDAMLAEFRLNYGGKFKIVQCDEHGSEIHLTDADGVTTEWRMTWEQMQESRWPWKPVKGAKGQTIPISSVPVAQRELKTNWSTAEDRENMMWARLVSKALRRVCPELVAGVYTPEEAQDFTPEDNGAAPAERPKAAEVIDASFTTNRLSGTFQSPAVVPDVQSPGQQFDSDGNPAELPEANVSDTQLNRMRELRKTLGVGPSKWDATLSKRGVATESELTFNAAKDLIGRLEEAAKKV